MLHIGKWISYPETFTWLGGLKYASLTNDQELLKHLKDRFELLFTTEKALLPIKNHVDVNMFGCLPLELYKITKERRYIDLGLPYADTQWELPEKAKTQEKSWFQKVYLQPIITQYFIDNKSEIWLLFLIAHSKR